MTRITYEFPVSRVIYNVRLHGKLVGTICQDKDGYYYYKPKNGYAGNPFPSIAEVKKSIEGE